MRLPSSAADALVVAWLIVAASLYRWSGSTIDHFAQDRENIERVVEAIRGTIDRTPAGEPVYIRNQWFPYTELWPGSFAGWAAIYTIFFPGKGLRRVYFVEPNPAVRDVARPGSPLAAILVPASPGQR